MTTEDRDRLPELEWTESNYIAERTYCRATADEFVRQFVPPEKQHLALVVLGGQIRDERHFARRDAVEKLRTRIAELEAEVVRLSHVPTDAELDADMTPEQRREEHEQLLIAAEKTVRDTWGEPLRRIVDHVAGAMRLQRRDASRGVATQLRKVAGTLRNLANGYAQLLSNDPRIPNYTEAIMLRSSDGVAFTVTVQRIDGKSPAQMLGERDAEWRAAVNSLLTLELGGPRRTLAALMSDVIDEPDDRLSDEGIHARGVFRRVRELINDPPPLSIQVDDDGVPHVK